MKYNSPEELIVKKAPKAAIDRIDKLCEKLCDEENTYKNKYVSLPHIFNVMELVLILPSFLSMFIVCKLFQENFEFSSDTIGVWCLVFCPGIISLIMLLIIASVRKKRKNKYEKSERYALYQKRIDALFDGLYLEMGVPADSPYIDIIYFSYREKNDEIKPDITGKYDNLYKVWDLKVFSDKKKFYFSNDEEMYAIDLDKIKRIIKADKVAYLSADEKQERRLEKYKKHNVKGSALTGYKIQPYILEYEHNNEKWGIYFPHYEQSVIEELTGIKAQ